MGIVNDKKSKRLTHTLNPAVLTKGSANKSPAKKMEKQVKYSKKRTSLDIQYSPRKELTRDLGAAAIETHTESQHQPPPSIQQEQPTQASVKVAQSTNSPPLPSVNDEQDAEFTSDYISSSVSCTHYADGRDQILVPVKPVAQSPFPYQRTSRPTIEDGGNILVNTQKSGQFEQTPERITSHQSTITIRRPVKVQPEVISLLDDSNDNEEEFKKLSSVYWAHLTSSYVTEEGEDAPNRSNNMPGPTIAAENQRCIAEIVDLLSSPSPAQTPTNSLVVNPSTETRTHETRPRVSPQLNEVSQSSATGARDNGASRTQRRNLVPGLIPLHGPQKSPSKTHARISSHSQPKGSACEAEPASKPGQKGSEDRTDSNAKSSQIVRVQELSCPICLDNLKTIFTTKCGHIFCETCIYQAVVSAKKCPICRSSVKHAHIHQIFL